MKFKVYIEEIRVTDAVIEAPSLEIVEEYLKKEERDGFSNWDLCIDGYDYEIDKTEDEAEITLGENGEEIW